LGFKDLTLKEQYFSDDDNIIDDFFIPVLKNSKKYYRLAGFFSSKIFVRIAEGLSRFIDDGGKIFLVAGALLSNEDIKAINRGIKEPKKCIEEFLMNEFKTTENKIISDHIKTLAYMVANNQLEIKIALIKDTKGMYLDYDEINRKGIFHIKTGIFSDDYNNLISFSGSVNETLGGWSENIEEFKVFKSWSIIENRYLIEDVKKFEKIWQGETNRFELYNIPDIIHEYLADIILLDGYRIDNIDNKIVLREYQVEALNSWKKNNYKGILEMATGTGKTYTAINCILEVQRELNSVFTVIACPYTHLLEQWEDNLSKYNLNSTKIFGEVTKWKEVLNRIQFEYNINIIKNPIIITTQDTLSNNDFINIIKRIEGNSLIIGDEVHYLGATKRSIGLLSDYNLRLGLSATPNRWFDEEGSQEIINYFDKVVFIYNIKRAIDEGYLVKYSYNPYFIELNEEEIDKYKELTSKVAKSYYSSNNVEKNNEIFKLFLILRRRVIINAENKYAVLINILKNLSPVKKCLIYCSPEQIDRVQDILNNLGIMQHKFTFHEDNSTRQKLLDSFSSGSYQALVAMRCLDEGVDVPSTERAILMASSTNPKEFIQRRGRILRPFPGKDIAHIFDIIVVPTMSGSIDPGLYELERKIIITEMKRFREFSINSINAEDIQNMTDRILKKYEITEEDLL
jgi:superfamily II DNA or RNA helicase